MESMRRGIGVPPESPAAADAEQRRIEALRHPPPEAPLPESGMGGTSDAETAADEVRVNATLRRGRAEEEEQPREDRRVPGAEPDDRAGG